LHYVSLNDKKGSVKIITKRDKQIIKFVEIHGCITINQCAKMFFRDNKEAYDQARKRLRTIYKGDHLKRYRKDIQSEVVYFIDKKLKIHDIKLMDVFAELNAFDVVKMKKECTIEIDKYTKYRVDAFISMMALERPLFFIEIDYTHFTSLKKIKELYYYYRIKHGVYPTFIIVKLTQEEPEVMDLGEGNKGFILPWNLKGLTDIIGDMLGLAAKD